MAKKILMLPVMAFALITLTAATVIDDGEDIFDWEVVSGNTDLPEKEPDENISWSTENNENYETNIYDEKGTLDVYISFTTSMNAGFYYNYNNQYNSYSDTNMIDIDTGYNGSANNYIHIKITNYYSNDISIIGGNTVPSIFEEDAPQISSLKTYSYDPPTVIEEIGGALSTIVTAGSSVFVSTFDGLWDVFWDADANDGDGALNWIAYVAVLPVGFFLVRWAFRKVLGMIQQRL